MGVSQDQWVPVEVQQDVKACSRERVTVSVQCIINGLCLGPTISIRHSHPSGFPPSQTSSSLSRLPGSFGSFPCVHPNVLDIFQQVCGFGICWERRMNVTFSKGDLGSVCVCHGSLDLARSSDGRPAKNCHHCSPDTIKLAHPSCKEYSLHCRVNCGQCEWSGEWGGFPVAGAVDGGMEWVADRRECEIRG